MDKKLKLKVGDFFHVEVVETDESEVDNNYISGYKLEIKDGPVKNCYMYFDVRLNPHLKVK